MEVAGVECEIKSFARRLCEEADIERRLLVLEERTREILEQSFKSGMSAARQPRRRRVIGTRDELIAATELVVSAEYFEKRHSDFAALLRERVKESPTLWQTV